MHRRYDLRILFLVFASGTIAAGQPAGTFTATGSMTTPRFGHTATLLDDGRVLIAGGCLGGTAFWPGNVVTASAELYDPVTGTFTPTGSMTTPRCYHNATLLPDGRVLIASGYQDSSDDNLASAELYDPSTGVFTPTGSMTTTPFRAGWSRRMINFPSVVRPSLP